MLNKVILMGRLTRDPELRYTQSNIPVASFSLAVDRAFKGKGEQQQTTDFIDVVAWRSTAEFVSKWFTKGRMMAVVGTLQVRNWQDKDGNNRKSTEVVADEVSFCGDGKRTDGDEGRFAAPSQGGSPFSAREERSFGDRSFNDRAPQEKSFGGGLPASDFEEISDDDDELPF
jgi:single-strand DNA-binding protein